MLRNNNKKVLMAFVKYFLLFIIVFLLFIFQMSFFSLIPIFKASPNFLLFITFITGFIFGESYGLYVGCICGVLCDIFYTGQFGYFTLIYIIIGFCNGILYNYIYDDNIITLIVLTLINSTVFNLYIYITHFLINGKIDIVNYFFNICLPQNILILLISLLCYNLVVYLKHKNISDD